VTVAAEARIRSRLLRVGLLLAIAGQIGWSFRPTTSRAQTDQLALGRTIYQANCSTCHGLNADGTSRGPSLQAVGAASVNFMLSSGRMPLAAPGYQPVRSTPKFDPTQIAAVVAYVQTIAPGGPPIPDVNPDEGSLSVGASLFLQSCAACHGAGATGDSVGGGQIAPSLDPPTATQIGEAIRTGPGEMPVFGEQTISDDGVNSIARYLLWIRDNGKEGGLQLGRVGAVAEGLTAIVIGLGLLVLVTRLTGTKT
jgi:ubiquinol-cytochrome c reductase cytochrome c subunit